MLKKVRNGFLALALMLLSVGGVCVLHKGDTSSKSFALEYESEVALDSRQAEILSLGNLSNTRTYYGESVITISSISDLALLAYNVNNNVGNYSSESYLLTCDLDMGGQDSSLWTPIGTSTYPFEGVFYGNGFAISNVTIDQSSCSDSYAGLFGYLSRAYICDVRLGGYYHILTSGATVGTMAGYAENSTFINCYDESQVTSDWAGQAIETLGESVNNKLYIGASYNGTAKNYSDATRKFRCASLATTGYVGFYYISSGVFNIQNSSLKGPFDNVAGNVTRIGVLLDTSFNPVGASGEIPSKRYLSYAPYLRANAVGTSKIYVFKASHKPNINPFTSSDKSTGFIKEITFSVTSINIVLDYKYGTRKFNAREASNSLKYDQTFEEFFAGNPALLNRAGYTLEGIYSDSACTQRIRYESGQTWDYETSFPVENATYYFAWNYDTSISRTTKVYFAYAGDEGGQMTSLFANLHGNILDSVSSIVHLSTSPVNCYSLTFAAGSDESSFGFALKAGYHIKSLEYSGVKNPTSVRESASANQAKLTSGIYAAFITTGNDPAYSSGGNSDGYNPVTLQSVQTNAESMRPGDAKAYQVQVSNVVGSNGEVWVVIEREYINIDLTPTFVAAPTAYEISLLSPDEKRFKFDSESNTLLVRKNESPAVMIKVTNKDQYLLALRYACNKPVSHSGVSGYETNINPADDLYTAWNISFNDVEPQIIDGVKTDFYASAVIGGVQSKASIAFYDENNNAITPEGVQINLNNSGFSGNTSLVPYSFGLQTSDDIIVTKSGKYEVDYITFEQCAQDSDGNYILDNGNFTYEAPVRIRDFDSTTNRYYSSIKQKAFTQAFQNNGEINYKISVKLKLRTYNVDAKYYFIDKSGNEIEIPSSFVNISSSLFSENNAFIASGINQGSTTPVSFTLSSLGQGVLSLDFAKTRLLMDGDTVNKEGQTITGEGFSFNLRGYDMPVLREGEVAGNKCNFTLTGGGYDTTIKFVFNANSLNFQIDKLKVDGESGLINYGYSLGNKAIIPLTFNITKASDSENYTLSLNGEISEGIYIHSQYYLLGWYLENGKVIRIENTEAGLSTPSFRSFLRDKDFISQAAASIVANGSDYVYTQMAALVGRRAVNVSYNAGEVNKGRFYVKSDDTPLGYKVAESLTSLAGKVTFDNSLVGMPDSHRSVLSLDNTVYQNLGYKFASFDSEYGYIDNLNNFSITAQDWYNLLAVAYPSLVIDSATGTQLWTGFVQAEDDMQVTVTFNWDAINYAVNIDDYQFPTLQIGARIYFETAESAKNGQATYYGFNEGNFNGSLKYGYVAVGFNISQNGSLDCLDDGSITLDVATFESLISQQYYFTANSSESSINITTTRNAAKYNLKLISSSYYTYSWRADETGKNEYGQKDEHGNILIEVTFASTPTNLLNAISTGTLSVTRKGYELAGWAIADEGGNQTTTKFNTDSAYSSNYDVSIVPIWTFTHQTANASEKYLDDVNVNAFYLLNSKDIVQGYISFNRSQNFEVANNLMLPNGERVTGFKLRLKKAGQEDKLYDSINIFNIDKILNAGTYNLVFEISVVDSLTKIDAEGVAANISYTSVSSPIEFEMRKNELTLTGSNLKSIYNGTNQFVKTQDCNFGNVSYKYAYDGQPQETSFDAEEYFNEFTIAGSDFNAGSGKSLIMRLNLDKFGHLAFENLLSNVTKAEDNYYFEASGLLTIEKAKFTIRFTSGSSYLFEDEETLVCTNDSNYNFSVGDVNFSYTYSKIVMPAGKSADTYWGQEDNSLDKANFKIYGLAIAGHESDLEANFEWNISKESSFTLLDPRFALGKTFNAKYLSASNGELADTLADSYDGLTESVKITKVVINGVEQPLQETDFGNYYIGSDVLFTFAGNGTSELKFYINKGLLESGTRLSIQISPMILDARNYLKVLTLSSSAITRESLTTLLERGYQNSNECTYTPSATEGSGAMYIVLGEVLKVNIDYNGGTNAEGASKEVIYLTTSQSVSVPNPISPSAYLAFDKYLQNDESKITLTKNSINYSMLAVNADKAENLVALWKIIDFNINVTNSNLSYYADEHAVAIASNSFFTLDMPEHITDKVFSLFSSDYIFDYSAASNAFIVADERGYAIPAMTGRYTLSVTLTFDDGVSSPSTFTKTAEINLTININQISLNYAGERIVFKNAVLDNQIALQMTLNGGEPTLTSTLLYLPKADNSDSDYHFYISIADNATLMSAGDYTINAKIDSDLNEIYQFTNGTDATSVAITIEKYTILLQDYKSQINLAKYIGSADPDPLSAKLIIEENAGDEVYVVFTRDAGNGIGDYPLHFYSFLNAEDENNYIVDETGFDGKFSIVSPTENLQVEFKEQLQIEYSGRVIESYQVSVSGSSFNLKVTAGDRTGNAMFDLYYISGENKIDVPGDQLDKYASYLIFSSNARASVGSYQLSVELSQPAIDEGWSGVEFAVGSINTVEVIARALDVTKIEKVFDRTDAIGANDATITNIVEGDSVTITGQYSQVTVGDNIPLKNLALVGTQAGNYILPAGDYLGKITPRPVDDISFNLNNVDFEYGQLLTSTSLDELLRSKGYTFTNGAFSDDIQKGYITISRFDFSESDTTSANALKAGLGMQLRFYLTSENFSGLRPYYTVSVNVSTKAINLSSLEISKMYDGTSLLPSTLSSDLSAYILEGDEVRINLRASHYDNEAVGENKVVTIILEGLDCNNYTPQNAKGSISAFAITFNVNATTENESLVTGGGFKDDGEVVTVRTTKFMYSYPATLTAEQIISDLMANSKLPTRKGYHVTGWKMANGDAYQSLTAENVLNVIRSIAEDELNTEKEITIFANWEIDKYKITISSQNTSSITATATEGVLTQTEGQYYVEYLSSVNVDVVCQRGYKIKAFNLIKGKALSRDLSQNGNALGTAKINGITSDIELGITTSEIQITFSIDFNKPEYCERIDNQTLVKKFVYSALANADINNLPALRVTEGSYHFTTFEVEGESLGEKKLKEVVDTLYPQLLKDEIIVLVAQWQNEEYEITFDVNGGTLSGSSKISAYYGQPITGFPTAVLSGKDLKWVDENGKVYSDGDTLLTLGRKEGDKFTLTFTAVWTNSPHTITLNFGSRLKVSVNGEEISSGQVYTLVYNETKLRADIVADEGYSFALDKTMLQGDIEEGAGYIVVSNLVADSTLGISSQANLNTLRIYTTFASVSSVKIDGNDSETSLTISAYTGSSVEVLIAASKGYSFDRNDLSPVGKGDFEINVASDKRSLTLIWSGFTGDASLSVAGKPADNVVTIGNIQDKFTVLTLNGKNINLLGDTFIIKTGQTLNVSGVLTYGYHAGAVVRNYEMFKVQDESCYYSASDQYYKYSASINEFNFDFTLDFTVQPRTFNFAVSIKEGQEDYGHIDCPASQSVIFGNSLSLKAVCDQVNYEFAGWEIDGKIVETNIECNLMVNLALKDLLAKAGESGTTNVYALFIRKERVITFASVGEGYYIASQGDRRVEVKGAAEGKFYLGVDLIIDLVASRGYEIENLYLDEYLVNSEAYISGEGKLALPLDLDNPIQKVKITFKPSQIYVTVQAGTSINYAQSLGNTIGGAIYAVDSEGNRLPNDRYLAYEGSTVIGGNYRLLSYTGQTLYFEVESRTGFTPQLNLSVGLAYNQITTASGKIIYEIKGAEDGSTIKLLFTAKENNLEIMFVTIDNPDNPVPGGIIAVDTSSNLVSANPNRNYSLSVNMITGSDLSLDINTFASHKLVTDENGKLRYEIIYHNVTSQGGDSPQSFANISVSTVVEKDITTTGYKHHATLSANEVNASATILLFVEPKQYTINFVIDDEVVATLGEKVTYGQTWDLSSLSKEDKAKVFANKPEYTFNGYYTKKGSWGRQYIDKYKEISSVWQDTGYNLVGGKYIQDTAYDPSTDTFTLFADYIYNSSSLRIEMLPSSLISPSYNIYSFVTNISDYTPWIEQDDLWYAKFPSGTTLNLAAPSIAGYTFIGFTLSFDRGQPSNQGLIFSINNMESGDYVATAKYLPNYSIVVKNNNNQDTTCGTSYLRQDGVTVATNYYNCEKLLSLVAKPSEGYNFLYWIDNASGEKIYASKVEGGESIYEYQNLIDSPLNLTAVFEGKEIDVELDLQGANEYYEVLSIVVGGGEITLDSDIIAHVGDEIEIKVKKERGYGFGENLFDPPTISGNVYLFRFKFTIDKLTEKDDRYSITLSLPIVRESISFTYEIVVDDEQENEVLKAGTMTLYEGQGNKVSLATGQSRVAVYGDAFTVEAKANDYYKFDCAMLISDAIYDISEYMNDGKLTIDKTLEDRFFNHQIRIQFKFARLLWTDDEAIAHALPGRGTSSNPYLIRSAREFAFMASMVNSGAANEGGLKYADAYYIVQSDINFEGRYWIPVGTKDNPFNGHISLGGYEFTGVKHYRRYENPSTIHSGLFRYVTKNAELIVNRSVVKIIVLVICLLILVIFIVLLIVYLNIRRRKKDIEDFANG